MCIIINKIRGLEKPSKETLKNCWDSNPDGAGVMWNEEGKVHIRKGFMDFDSFYKFTETIQNPTEKGIVYHFRITSHGGTSQQNTHPFPLAATYEELRTLDVLTDIGFCHNGIISETSNHRDIFALKVSDTMVFIKDYIVPILALSERELNETVMMLINTIGRSKFSFLTPDGEIKTLGHFVEDEVTKLTFSNSTYKKIDYAQYAGYTVYGAGRYSLEDLEEIEEAGEKITIDLEEIYSYYAKDPSRIKTLMSSVIEPSIEVSEDSILALEEQLSESIETLMNCSKEKLYSIVKQYCMFNKKELIEIHKMNKQDLCILQFLLSNFS